MAKTSKKKKSSKKKTSKASKYPRGKAVDATGKHLVIVESPTKAKTINKYLGSDYVVMASVGHVRDLPPRNPKGVKNPVPGVDLENRFTPTYEILSDKKKTVADLKRAAKQAADIWFATDLDREGEAIAWHLAQALGSKLETAKRVVFNAITKSEIEHAFSQPRPIDINRVNAQQARRILDRIVGYQVSPLLWKKVAGGLSAGRVQSVASGLVVKREREIEAFVPDEMWNIMGYFATELDETDRLAAAWKPWLADVAEGKERTIREKLQWLNERKCLRSELTKVDGKTFKESDREAALKVATAIGFTVDETKAWEDPKAKGPAKNRVIYVGHIDNAAAPKFEIESIQTKATSSRPAPPFITSTLQQAASTRIGFSLKRTMRVAQQLYEGIDLKGVQGQTGLITYMRTDSTHVSGEALSIVRDYVGKHYGDDYLPAKPNFYSSSNKSAQEAHEAIRPTDVNLDPEHLRHSLSEDQFKLYRLVWQRFVSCQMTPAKWNATTVLINTPNASVNATFKTTGRTLLFDGFYKVTGLPNAGNEAILPPLKEGQEVGPLQIDPSQQFTSPPARYTEASLQKKLEEEGIGRPSTYAAIISTIQDRNYVEQIGPRDRRLRATDLGKVVTDKLVEAFPTLMDVAYTREMELELDLIEDEKHDWVAMLEQFYGPFKDALEHAHENMVHAKQEEEPAPHTCPKCESHTVYRFGKNGRFLSCGSYPDCKYAAPIDHEGNPLEAEVTDIACPICNGKMTRRRGRFGPFLGCEKYPECKGIVKLDAKKGTVVLPKPPPMEIDLPCPKCDSPLNMRRSKRGPWLSCSKFPKCRGRAGWAAIEDDKKDALLIALDAHEEANPVPDVRTVHGELVDNEYIPEIMGTNGGASAGDGDTEAA